IPLLIGSAWGAGADSHLEWNVNLIKEIAREKGLSFKAAIISSQIAPETVLTSFEAGKLKAMPPAPAPTEQNIKQSANIVAQMGEEPFIAALESGAQVIIAGRAYDPAVFAAPAISAGFNPGLALHMGKILECAAIAALPGSGSDCMFGILREDHFELMTLNPARKCTITSVAAHTLYEKSNPTRLPGPGGVLDLSETTFEQNGDAVIVRGSRFIPDEGVGYIKLEAAKLAGYRTLSFAAAADPIMISQMDEIVKEVKERVSTNFKDIGEFYLDFKVYGANGAAFYSLTSDLCHLNEVAIIIEAIAKTPELSATICSFARSTLLHFGYSGRKSTAGNLAFPFSPSDFAGGAVYEFSLYCLMEARKDLFPIKIYDCKEGAWND
ncbi:MAG: DUF1446 domain-containing protein, partial [Clostridiales bacterium]|nr:DUF1446 domain-containing protein [Clostridiales bacterium]